MKSADYTLPFYKKCLSQHLWDWRSRFVTTAVVRHHEANEEMLKRVAHERGDEFLEAYNKVSPQPLFPFAGIPAAEIPNEPTHNTTPMKIEIHLPEELFNPLVQAIDRLTEAVKANGPVRYAGTLKDYSSDTGAATGTSDSASTAVIDGVTEADKPKRGRKPKEPEAAPAVVEATVEETPQVVTPAAEVTPVEAPPSIPCPTGPELAKKVEPLAAHPELQQELIRFKANDLKINQPIRLVTDEDLLRRFNVKVDELLAKIPTEV